MIKIAIIADGRVDSSGTNSGVALGIARALERRADVDVVGKIDGRVTGWRRWLLAVATARYPRHAWWANFNLGALNIRLRSRKRDTAVGRLDEDPDYVLHIRNIYLPSRYPYLVFIDSTSQMANSGWTSWAPKRRIRRERLSIEAMQFRGAAHIFTAGQQARASVIEDYGIDEDRVTAIGGGVNFDPLPVVEDRPLGSRASSSRILFVGMDFERKGGDVLLAAFEQVRSSWPESILTVVGPAPMRAVPGVVFLGPVKSRSDLEALYRSSAIFCLPARHEPYGLVLQEAMAFALPCVGSRVGAIDTIIDESSTGLIVLPDDPSALASAILELIENPERSRAMGKAGRRKAELTLTWDSVAARMVQALHQETSVGARCETERAK